MKKIISKYKFWVLLLLLGSASCEKNKPFLTETPSTFYTIDNAYSSSAQVDQILVSCYSQIRNLWRNFAWSDYRPEMDYRGSNGTDVADVMSLRIGSAFNNYAVINSLHPTFGYVYNTFYKLIAQANLAIHVSELPQISWASGAEKKYAQAQAKFFRAFAYRNLAELFGGVPIVKEIAATPKYDYKRATRVETYQFAIDDLLAIEEDLPETTSSGGRIVKGAAQHYLCELYLALGTELAAEGNSGEAQTAFTNSISYGNKVIDGGKYNLMTSRFGKRSSESSITFPVYENGILGPVIDTVQAKTNVYWDLFQEGNVNYQNGNTECLWAVQIDYEAFKSEDRESVLSYSGTYGPVFRVSPHLIGLLEDAGGYGICETNITMYARDIIYSGVWANDMRNSESVFRRRFKGNVPTSPYFKKIIPWDAFYYGSNNAGSNQNMQSLCYPVSCKIATDKYTGVDQGEFRTAFLFRDDYIIRLPETILLRAEAKQRKGDIAGAAADINLLRARAQCGYKVTAADMDDKFDLILDERARELVYEECRWNTLLRMGGTIAVDRIRKYAFWPQAKATLTFNYNLWPIPQDVIDTNKDAPMKQNEGW